MVNKSLQPAADAEPGDTVEVPPGLSDALVNDAAAQARLEALPYSHQKECMDWIESAKRARDPDRTRREGTSDDYE